MKKRFLVLALALLAGVSAFALSYKYLRPTAGLMIMGVPSGYVQVELKDVQVDHGSGLVYLNEIGGTRVLPIYISSDQAQTITMLLDGIPSERPMMHDLMGLVLDYGNMRLEYVTVDKLENGIYYSTVVLETGKSFALDARPSDGIILALSRKVPMYVNEKLLKNESVRTHPPVNGLRKGFSV